MAPSDPPLFYQETISLYIALAPSSLSNAYAHICAERFSPLLLSYYPPVRGIILSFSNVRLSATPPSSSSNSSSQTSSPLILAKAADEYSASFLWVTVDFLVYRLQRDVRLEGRVKVQTETHITLSHLNALSVYIPRTQIPKEWRWIADPVAEGLMDTGDEGGRVDRSHGYYVDGKGDMVDTKNVEFLVRDFDMKPRTKNNKGYIKIDGSLLGVDGEGGERDEVLDSVAEDVEMGEPSTNGLEKVKKKKKRDKDGVEGSEKKKKRDKSGVETSEKKKKKRKKDKEGITSQMQPIEVS